MRARNLIPNLTRLKFARRFFRQTETTSISTSFSYTSTQTKVSALLASRASQRPFDAERRSFRFWQTNSKSTTTTETSKTTTTTATSLSFTSTQTEVGLSWLRVGPGTADADRRNFSLDQNRDSEQDLHYFFNFHDRVFGCSCTRARRRLRSS